MPYKKQGRYWKRKSFRRDKKGIKARAATGFGENIISVIPSKTLNPRRIGLPPRLKMKHNFYFRGQFILGGGFTIGQYIYGANGLFQPDPGNNIRPPLFNNMALLYANYRVINCRATVQFQNKDNQRPCEVAIVYRGASTANISDPLTHDWKAFPNAVTSLIGESGGGHDVKTLVLNMNIPLLEGPSVYTDDKYHGTATLNPSYLLNFAVMAASIDGVALQPTTGVIATVSMDYTVIWETPVVENQTINGP